MTPGYALANGIEPSATMFAKRAKQSSKQPPPSDDGSSSRDSPGRIRASRHRAARARARGAARAAKTLRESLDAATFKIEILEKSYAKQLAEARDKRAATDTELKEKNEILANLGGGHEHTLRELNDALTVIKVLKTERDKLRKQIAQGGFRQPNQRPTRAQLLVGEPIRRHECGHERGHGWRHRNDQCADRQYEAGPRRKPQVGGVQVTAKEEPPHQEMIAPDLVFTDKDKEDER